MRARHLVALAALLVPGAALAQGVEGGAGAYNVQRRVWYQSAVHEQTGLLVGGGAALRLGRLRIGVDGVMGTLKAAETSAGDEDVTVRSTAVRALFAVAPALLVGVQAEARRFEADAGVTMWRLMGASLRFEPGLGREGVRALADVSVLPASSVSGGPKLTMAVEATLGVSVRLPRSPLGVRIAYRFERFDVEATGTSPERYEQFRGLVAEASLRLGR